MRARLPSTPTLIGLGLCTAILAFATADLVHTESRLPGAAVSCLESDAACRNVELTRFY